MTRLLRRVADSPAARDLRDVRLASPAGAFVVVLVLLAAVLLALATRGQHATWTGFEPLPSPANTKDIAMSTAAWWVVGVTAYFAVALPAARRLGRALARAAECCPHDEAGR